MTFLKWAANALNTDERNHPKEFGLASTGVMHTRFPLATNTPIEGGDVFAYREFPLAGGPLDAPDFIQAGCTLCRVASIPARGLVVGRGGFKDHFQ